MSKIEFIKADYPSISIQASQPGTIGKCLSDSCLLGEHDISVSHNTLRHFAAKPIPFEPMLVSSTRQEQKHNHVQANPIRNSKMSKSWATWIRYLGRAAQPWLWMGEHFKTHHHMKVAPASQ
jgi:hypothetical protein